MRFARLAAWAGLLFLACCAAPNVPAPQTITPPKPVSDEPVAADSLQVSSTVQGLSGMFVIYRYLLYYGDSQAADLIPQRLTEDVELCHESAAEKIYFHHWIDDAQSKTNSELNDDVRRGRLPSNPARRADLPKGGGPSRQDAAKFAALITEKWKRPGSLNGVCLRPGAS